MADYGGSHLPVSSFFYLTLGRQPQGHLDIRHLSDDFIIVVDFPTTTTSTEAKKIKEAPN